MITSVRFCLSYERFKFHFNDVKFEIISVENFIVTYGHTIFMTLHYTANINDVIRKKKIQILSWR